MSLNYALVYFVKIINTTVIDDIILRDQAKGPSRCTKRFPLFNLLAAHWENKSSYNEANINMKNILLVALMKYIQAIWWMKEMRFK